MKSISVIVPVYYGEVYVPDLIWQVERCKEHLNKEDTIEILLVNDAPDAPLSNCWRSESIQVIVMNTDRNVGIHGARVKGLLACLGEYVLFLDQDDKIKSEYFDSQFQKIGANDAVVCKAVRDGKDFYFGNNLFQNMISKEYMFGRRNWIISPGQVLLRKQAVPTAWIENILEHNGADDWFLWLCMLENGCVFSLNEDILYEHVWHGTNASSNIAGMLESEYEIVQIGRRKKLFSVEELNLLTDGIFQRSAYHLWEYDFTRSKLKLLDQWLLLKEKNRKLSSNLLDSGIQTIAIYGCGFIGRHLYAELKEDMEVRYFIDKNADRLKEEIPVYLLKHDLPKVDGVMITLIDQAEETRKEIREVFDGEIMILKDWIQICSQQEIMCTGRSCI